MLDTEGRSRLSRTLAEHTAGLARRFSDRIVVVTADPDVRAWAVAFELEALADPGDGLDGAAGAAVRLAREVGRPWMILHADLPALATADLPALWSARPADGFVIAPSHDGGTPAIGGAGSVPFSYGPGSFHRHLAAIAPFPHAVVVRDGLAIDLDLPADLEPARWWDRMAWIRDLVGETALGAAGKR